MSPQLVPSIGFRLTAWYTLVLCLMLVLYASATFVTVRHEFLEQLDDDLYEDFETAEGLLVRTRKAASRGPTATTIPRTMRIAARTCGRRMANRSIGREHPARCRRLP